MSKQKSSHRRLPPLVSPSSSVETRISRQSTSSKYHSKCMHSTRPLSPGPGGYLEVNARRISARSNKSPRPPRRRLLSQNSSQRVVDYLKKHEDFLEQHVLQNVSLDLLERWIIRKTQRQRKSNEETKNSSDKVSMFYRWKFGTQDGKKELLQELTSNLFSKHGKQQIIAEMANSVASAVNAKNWRFSVCDPDTKELCTFGSIEEESGFSTESTLAEYVIQNKQAVHLTFSSKNDCLPEGISNPFKDPVHVLCHPVFKPPGEISGVLELYKDLSETEFLPEDDEVVESYLSWSGIALHYVELYVTMMKQRELNMFLLTVVKSIFQELLSMDTVILKIMMFARKLVSADRASLFLVDNRAGELYARIFDVSSSDAENQDKNNLLQEIRFPIGKGIAGYVAKTGESLNIPDAYNDSRFNRSVDQITGYNTKNLLCMPIFIRGSVIGVVQMVNKSSGAFTKNDEESFATFAIYCGLALHHTKLYDKIRRSEQKNKLALEILSYHSTCTEQEIKTIEGIKLQMDPEDLRKFSFSSLPLTSDEKVVASIFMMNHLPRVQNFVKIDLGSLVRFTLTVRKNYRRVPYHNWTHGFSVANSAYAVIRCCEVFEPLEELALYVACLCHDLDHRGKTNQFLVNAASPLAAIYSTSVLEHHHFNMTVSILQQDGHNIFSNLSSSDYKKVLNNIKHCILATDLALFFPNKAKLQELISENLFDWQSSEHRYLLHALVMTACDLCGSTKSWDLQKDVVKVIFEEFYDQGDAEKSQGWKPMPIMDRCKVDEQPESQVGFLKGICIPCYELLYTLIPEVKPMLDGCRTNLETWNSIAESSEKSESTNAQPASVEENL